MSIGRPTNTPLTDLNFHEIKDSSKPLSKEPRIVKNNTDILARYVESRIEVWNGNGQKMKNLVNFVAAKLTGYKIFCDIPKERIELCETLFTKFRTAGNDLEKWCVLILQLVPAAIKGYYDSTVSGARFFETVFMIIGNIVEEFKDNDPNSQYQIVTSKLAAAFDTIEKDISALLRQNVKVKSLRKEADQNLLLLMCLQKWNDEKTGWDLLKEAEKTDLFFTKYNFPELPQDINLPFVLCKGYPATMYAKNLRSITNALYEDYITNDKYHLKEEEIANLIELAKKNNTAPALFPIPFPSLPSTLSINKVMSLFSSGTTTPEPVETTLSSSPRPRITPFSSDS